MTVSTTIFELVLALVSVGYDIPKDWILAHGRKERVALARHAFWYILRERFNWTFEEIGLRTKLPGGKGYDHGSVIWGVERVRELPPNDRRRVLVGRLMQQATALADHPTFEESTGCSLVIQNAKTGEVKEAYIEALSKIGDGVKMRLNSNQKSEWTSRREWIVLDRVTT